MFKIGLILEGKTPPDTRVALTPTQCTELTMRFPDISIFVQPAPHRCYTDEEYRAADVLVQDDLSNCDLLLGIKEVPIDKLIPGKTYCFFSHTKKKQPYNQQLMRALIEKRIRLIDYEALTYDDGQRILGFGFFAGVVGAHNGLLAYGKKTGLFHLDAAHESHDMAAMMHQYAHVDLPPLKIAVTGSGRVATGILEIMQAWNIKSVEAEDFLKNEYEYPVYTLLKGAALYEQKVTKTYSRNEFHAHPEDYNCKFLPYTRTADILMNGIYWDKKIARLFEKEDAKDPEFSIQVIADITCDMDGSVPLNLGASTIADPVYGYDLTTGNKTAPFINDPNIIDIMAVDNLPNELPRDASEHFGIQMLRFVLPEFLNKESKIITRATICEGGRLGTHFEYLSDYAYS